MGKKHTYWDREATNYILFDMASRIISETTKKDRGKSAEQRKHKLQEAGDPHYHRNTNGETDMRAQDAEWGSHIRQELAESIGGTKHNEASKEGAPQAQENEDQGSEKTETNRGYSGNPNSSSKNSKAHQGKGKARTSDPDTLIHDIEALRMLWVKADTSWDTAAVFGEHKKKLRAFSEDYKYRRSKLLGHIIRADNSDPMRKVTLAADNIVEWGFDKRRVGRPKDQWLFETKKAAWKKCRHLEDRQGHKKQNKRTKYRGKLMQDAYIHTWADERRF